MRPTRRSPTTRRGGFGWRTKKAAAGWGKDFGAYDTHRHSAVPGTVDPAASAWTGRRARRDAGDPWARCCPALPTCMWTGRAQRTSEGFDPDSARADRKAGRRREHDARNAGRSQQLSAAGWRIPPGGSGWPSAASIPIWWNSVGTVWTEHLISYDGSSWTDSIYLHHTDNLLDNRPALVSVTPANCRDRSSDGRRQYRAMSFMPGMKTAAAQETETPDDPFQNDLYPHRCRAGPRRRQTGHQAAPAVTVAGRDPLDKARKPPSPACAAIASAPAKATSASCAASSTGTARSPWMAANDGTSSTSTATCSMPAPGLGRLLRSRQRRRPRVHLVDLPEAHRHLL